MRGGDILTKIERSIEINVPLEKIWPMIQWDRTPEWYAPWTKVEWTSKEKDKVVSTVHITAELDVKTELDSENKKVSFRSMGKIPQLVFTVSLPQTVELR